MAGPEYQDIRERTFNFAVRIVNLANHIPQTNAGKVLARQLVRSGTSIGANTEEAVAAYSKDDFIFKSNVALREARETHYWLKLLQATKTISPNRLSPIIDEAEQIKKILGSIVSRAKGKSK
jgi:four helix bundle protein